MRIAEVIGTVTLSRMHPAVERARWIIGVPFSLKALEGDVPDGGRDANGLLQHLSPVGTHVDIDPCPAQRHRKRRADPDGLALCLPVNGTDGREQLGTPQPPRERAGHPIDGPHRLAPPVSPAGLEDAGGHAEPANHARGGATHVADMP